MAVQLLEDWLLKEQEKIITTYRELNQAPLEGAWFDLYRRLHRRVFSHS